MNQVIERSTLSLSEIKQGIVRFIKDNNHHLNSGDISAALDTVVNDNKFANSLDKVESLHRRGLVNDYELTAYYFLWRNFVPRFSSELVEFDLRKYYV